MVGHKAQKERLCGYVECKSCHEYVEAVTQMFHSGGKILSRRKWGKAGLATSEANGEGGGGLEDEDKPPLHVFFYIETMQETGRHNPNLLIAESEHDHHPEQFKWEACTRHFLGNHTR